MKLAISTGFLFLLLGTIAPANAQQRERENRQPERQHQQERPTERSQQTYGGAYHGGVHHHHSGVPQQQKQVQADFLQSRASSWNQDHRSWSQRGGYNAYRIPEDRFRKYFGSNNSFVINSLPIVFVGGYPRFQYDGYWVTLIDPWPESWQATWFQTDDVYIDYTADGYYLYNRRHPDIGIAVTISF